MAAPLLALLVLVAFPGVFRLGLFADDFIFIDAVRRLPFGEVLLGWHGIWPWYRPLSRELFFAIANLAGGSAAGLAHGLSLACLWVGAVAFHKVVSRRFGSEIATTGVALFICHSLTWLLVGWLSGFQDLLAMTLTFSSLRLRQERRQVPAIVCAVLATLAKELGALAFLLIAVDVWWERGRSAWRSSRAWIPWVIGGSVAILIHLLVRLTWPARSSASPMTRELHAILPALAPWTTPPGPADLLTWTSAVLAGLVVATLVVVVRDVRAPSRVVAPIALVPVLLVTAAPIAFPTVVMRFPLQPHFFFGVLPWLCVLGGWALTRLPRVAWRIALPVVCAALVWTSSPRVVDLDVAAGWQSGALGWTETQRIEARTRRLEEDVRRLLGARPESLAIGFIHLPIGGYFQTGDGPAVRVALDDPTARSWMIRDIPDRILNDPRAPLALLDYDSYVAHRLIGLRPDDPGVIRAACEQLLRGKGRSALVLARYAGRADSSDILPAYLAMASSLAEGGTRADFARIAPSVRGRPVRGALAVGEPHTARALSIAVADPIVPDVHRQAADSLHAHGAPMLEAVELWIAVQLDPTRAADALRLGRLIAGPMPDAARRAFVIASAPGAPPEVLAQARAATSALPPDRETP